METLGVDDWINWAAKLMYDHAQLKAKVTKKLKKTHYCSSWCLSRISAKSMSLY